MKFDFYASIYTYHSNDILLNLTETFELANKYCPNADNDRQFNTLHEAEVACADDEACIGVDKIEDLWIYGGNHSNSSSS